MARLLIQNPLGIQELIEVGEGGAYDGGPILWDERIDGSFPQAALSFVGWLAKNGNTLVPDVAKKAIYDAWLAAEAVKAAAEATNKIQKFAAIARIKDYDDDTASLAQQKQFRKDVQRLLKQIFAGD